jgi:hypothetical protein
LVTLACISLLVALNSPIDNASIDLREQAFIMFKKGQVKASEAEIDRAQGGYLSTSALLEAQQNITNIYGKVSQQMTSAKQSGLLFDVAR